jgi:hypothetical protein
MDPKTDFDSYLQLFVSSCERIQEQAKVTEDDRQWFCQLLKFFKNFNKIHPEIIYHSFMIFRFFPEFVSYLLTIGVDVNFKNGTLPYWILAATKYHDLELVTFVLNNGGKFEKLSMDPRIESLRTILTEIKNRDDKIKNDKREYIREYNREYNKKYSTANREKINAWSRNYYYNNKEKLLEQQKKYVAANKEKINAWSRNYYKNNKEKIIKIRRKHYLKKKSMKEKEYVL